MNESGCIGLYDSGVGGLTVVREIANQLPRESVIYFGDTARVPYGDRRPEEIVRFGREIGRFLVDQGVKIILVACNTSSALALTYLQAELPVPVLGIIDAAAQVAARASFSGRIGVMATAATAGSGAYERAIRAVNSGHEVYVQGCPALVPMIEDGRTDGPEVRETVAGYVRPLLERQIDTIVYGCTHYPFLDHIVGEITGTGTARVDPAAALVNQVGQLLKDRKLAAEAKTMPERFIVSKSPEHFRALGSLFLQRSLPPVEQISLEGYGLA